MLVSEKVIRNGVFQIHYSLHMPDGFIGNGEHEGWMIDGPTHTIDVFCVIKNRRGWGFRCGVRDRSWCRWLAW